MAITLNPMVTTGASGAFVLSTDGFVQGTMLDSPTDRYQLEGGYVDSGESNPIWGGLPLKLKVPAVGSANNGSAALGSSVLRADSLVDINAWAVFNQAAAMILTPSSPVPLATSGMSVNFFRPGSLARLAILIKASDVSGLVGAQPNVSLYWDPVNLYLTVTSSGNYGPLPVQLETLSNTSKTITYSGGNATWNAAGSVAIIRI